MNSVQEWEIKPETSWFKLRLNEVVEYKELMVQLVKRDLSINYKQTVLGPLWILLQPLLTTLVYVVVFNSIVKVPTNGIPPFLFFLSATMIWSFFSDCLVGTMYTFISNAHIFSKVYFPRLIVPLSNVLSQGVRLSVQLVVFLLFYLYYVFAQKGIQLSSLMLLLPLLILLTALLGLGLGLLISVFVAKYRDLENIVHLSLRLFMFVTPVFYSVASVPERYQFLLWLNPLTPIIETFRAAFVNGEVPVYYLLLSTLMTSALLIGGIVLFKKREIKVMDTV